MVYIPANISFARAAENTALSRLHETNLLGISFANCSEAVALNWLETRLAARRPARIAFLNAHCANVAMHDADYAAALHSAELVLPDGSGVALGLRLRGQKLAANLNGTDLIPRLCARLAQAGQAVFLLGGQPGVAEAAAEGLRLAAPGLIIAGTRHGFFTPEQEPDIIRGINASGADVLLVAMGVPLQDAWLARVAPQLRATLSFGVGGLFDFLSGRIPRAPSLLRRIGLEWTYRLYQEPRRMFRRYVLGNPAFAVRVAAETALPRADAAAKRLLDITGASLGLLLLAPFFLAVGAAIRLGSPGPALLRQTRIGENGKPFTLYKFRSMYQDAEARLQALRAQNQHGSEGVTFKMKRDPRVTAIGRLLRRSSVDELPQLLNVLNGSMSLVGPRPALPAEVAGYTPPQRARLRGKPGLTGLWQVSGRADLPFPRQVELDVDYLQHRNFLRDLAILARTVPAVLLARGAY